MSYEESVQEAVDDLKGVEQNRGPRKRPDDARAAFMGHVDVDGGFFLEGQVFLKGTRRVS